jgi:hypothetical protein
MPKPKPTTPAAIRAAGLDALRERLGRAGMVRFLQQLAPGAGDYTKERQAWLDQLSVEEIRELNAPRKTRRKRA